MIAVVVLMLANFAAQIFGKEVQGQPLDLALLEKTNEHEDVEMASGQEGFVKQPLVTFCLFEQ